MSSTTVLGLAITKGIAEAHGGTIEVTSVAGEGASFTVTLPLPEARLELAPPASRSSALLFAQ